MNDLSREDLLSFQLAEQRALRTDAQAKLALVIAQGALQAFESEKQRIFAAYSLKDGDSVDINTGKIARGP